MITHHPHNDMLLEHTAGALSSAFSLSITAHLEMCPQCRQQTRHFNHIGGELLESAPTQAPLPGTFSRLLNKIEQLDAQATRRRSGGRLPPATTKDPVNLVAPVQFAKDVSHKTSLNEPLVAEMPKVLRKLIPKDKPLHWSMLLPSTRVAHLVDEPDRDQVSLYRIARGGKIVEHNHRGLEVTLVLRGNFSDVHGMYMPGDFLVSEPGDVHKPTATQDQPCWFLLVTQARAPQNKFVNWLSKKF